MEEEVEEEKKRISLVKINWVLFQGNAALRQNHPEFKRATKRRRKDDQFNNLNFIRYFPLLTIISRTRRQLKMDFAALMSKELAKAKPDKAGDKKYTRKADVEADRIAAYNADQAARESARAAKESAKRKLDEAAADEKRQRDDKRARLAERSRAARADEEAAQERARRRRLGLPEEPPRDAQAAAAAAEEEDKQAAEDGLEDVCEEELVAQLRQRGQPAVLFGESHWQRVRRLQRVAAVVTDGPIPTTLAPVAEKDMKLDGRVPADAAGRRYLFRQLAGYFSMVLVEYERAMERERADTSASRTAYNAMVRCREDMKPVSFCFPRFARFSFPYIGIMHQS